MDNLENVSKVPCGFACVANVTSHRLEDRLDSYFFSETLKYLYLLFDEAYTFSTKNSSTESLLHAPFIFTTQGHIMPIKPYRDFGELPIFAFL